MDSLPQSELLKCVNFKREGEQSHPRLPALAFALTGRICNLARRWCRERRVDLRLQFRRDLPLTLAVRVLRAAEVETTGAKARLHQLQLRAAFRAGFRNFHLRHARGLLLRL